MINIEDKKFWNILKGIAILSIVIGHCCEKLVPFVYLYHLAIFFFISGYFYSEEKYGDNPGLNFSQRIKSNWMRYCFFCMAAVILHNVFLKLGMIINTTSYSPSEVLTKLINTAFFINSEDMAGAMWFVPVLIISSAFFGLIVSFSRKIGNYNSENKVLTQDFIIIFISLITGLIGLFLNYNNIYTFYHSETSLLVIPMYTLAYFVRKYIKDLNKYLNILVFIPVCFALYYFSYINPIRIDLSSNTIGNVYLFYFISLIGIYFCLYLAKLLNKIKCLNNIFELMGKYSFEIMALHFIIFKVIDIIYAGITSISDVSVYGAFPYAFKQLAPVYLVLGVGVPTLLFYLKDKITNKFKNKKEKKHLKKHKEVIFNKKNILKALFIVLIIVCFSLPIIKLGIMHNDELMSRYWSSQGFLKFYNHYFIEQIQKGRALSSIIIPFTQYLGFIGQKSYQFKLMQIISIIACDLSFAMLVKKITKNTKLSLVCGLFFLMFMQISFEPTVPNVFVTFYNISLIVLCCSLSLYYDYLENNSSVKLLLSMLLFFIVELSYESFVTYVPIFLLLFLYKKGFKNIFKNKKGVLLPMLAGGLYLALYIVFSKLCPSDYSGNQIGAINLMLSLKIIGGLGLYSFPGAYFISDKYRFLFSYYFKISMLDVFRIALFSILVLTSVIYIFTKYNSKHDDLDSKKLIKILFISIAGIVLPILPISVASMYQLLAKDMVYMGLPVSFFAYFCSILIVSSLFIYLIKRNRLIGYLYFTVLFGIFLLVQVSNSVFSRIAQEDFNRIERIEEFVSSDFLKELNGNTIYSKDLFTLKDALFVHDSYWNEFTSLRGFNINYLNEEGDKDSIRLYYNDINNVFAIYNNTNIYLFSENKIVDDNIVINDNEIGLPYKTYKKNNGYYTYYFKIKKGKTIQCQDLIEGNKTFNLCIN